MSTTTDFHPEVVKRTFVPEWEQKKRLKELGQRIQDVYTRERRRWDARHGVPNSQYTPGKEWGGTEDIYSKDCRNHKNIWPEIAAFVLAHAVDHEDFVSAQFVAWKRYPPKPSDLATETALGLYRDYAALDRVRLERSLKSQLDVAEMAISRLSLETGWSDRDVWASVLSDLSLSLTALFRFCVAHSEGLDKVARLFHDEAEVEYRRKRALYDLIWGKLIPAVLRQT